MSSSAITWVLFLVRSGTSVSSFSASCRENVSEGLRSFSEKSFSTLLLVTLFIVNFRYFSSISDNIFKKDWCSKMECAGDY